MTFTFDHVIAIVDSLDAAIRDFTAAGFTVVRGGRHDVTPTHNALIAFADGTYLELMAAVDEETRAGIVRRAASKAWERELRSGPAVGRRVLPRLAREAGVADYVLAGTGLERFAAESRRRGFELTGPTPMSRERPDGTRLDWQLLLPAQDHLPFFIEDVTPRDLRVPAGPARKHKNGARGVTEVRVHAASVAAAALEYADLFGVAPRATPDGTRMELAGVRVVLEPGEFPGAAAVSIAGIKSLPEAIEALGVHAAGV